MAFTFVKLALVLFTAAKVHAESHTVKFVNNCGKGTPQLIVGGVVVSSGEDYTKSGSIDSSIAYLQTGECLFNGEYCTLLELNMNNPACAGCGSSADISLIPTHEYNVEASFQYYGGDGSCDGLGANCADANCSTAFFDSDDNQVQRACQADDVNLLITFCGGTSTGFTEAVANSLSYLTDGSSSDSSSSSSSSLSSSSSSTSTSTHSTTTSTHTSTITQETAVTPSPTVTVAVNAVEGTTTTTPEPATTIATTATSSTADSAAPTCRRRRSSSSSSSTSTSASSKKRAHRKRSLLGHDVNRLAF